jgi:Flp pilus assembly CpaF family ATPase
MAFELVLPILRPIAHLITGPDVSEVMVNGSTGVFVERAGIVTAVAGVGSSPPRSSYGPA